MTDITSKYNVSIANDLNSDETVNTPQASTMMMASFRIDREVWSAFGAIAKRERLTVTDVLTAYIQKCTDKDGTEYGVMIGTDASASTDTYDTDKFNDAVMTAVSTAFDQLTKKITDLELEVVSIKKFDSIELVK